MEKHHSSCKCHEPIHPEVAGPDHSEEAGKIRSGNGIYSLESHLHEGASVVSGECSMHSKSPDRVRRQLMRQMEQLAEWVNAENGFIGHIKSGFIKETVEIFSVTNTELYVQNAESTGIKLHLAAIIFSVDQICLEKKIEEILQTLCSLP